MSFHKNRDREVWEQVTPHSAHHLAGQAVVGGYEGWDGSPLWVIKAHYGKEVVPGKFAAKHKTAYIPYNGNEVAVQDIMVLCGPSDKYHWVAASNGFVPPKAVAGGHTSSGETLYIGRANQEKSLTPGKIHASHGCCYISFSGKEMAVKSYDALCRI